MTGHTHTRAYLVTFGRLGHLDASIVAVEARLDGRPAEWIDVNAAEEFRAVFLVDPPPPQPGVTRLRREARTQHHPSEPRWSYVQQP